MTSPARYSISLTTTVLVCLIVATARPSAAQGASETLDILAENIEIGNVIYVEDDAGRRIKGKLEALSDSMITIRTLETFAQRYQLSSSSVARVTKVDSQWSGLYIGAVAGGVPALLLATWANALCNNEGPGPCAGRAFGVGAVLTAAGAWIGWEIDGAIDGETRVFERPQQTAGPSRRLTPVVSPDSAGLTWTLAF